MEVVRMKVIFVRHGKDDDKYRGGWSSLDLIPEGVEQAKQLAKYLKDNNHTYQIAHIISSDLTRTLTTANIISRELCLPIQKECQIRETNNGDLAGMLNETALKQYPGLFFNSLEMDEAYPNGESPKDFYLRIKKWFSDFLPNYHNVDGNILVVTHSGVINVVYHLVKGIEWTNKGRPFKVGNCSVHVLNMDTMEFDVENKTDFISRK
jgi:probable phosphoglycerate mutase